MKLEEAKGLLKNKPIKLSLRNGKYKVSFSDLSSYRADDTAYYTTNIFDAITMGLAMANHLEMFGDVTFGSRHTSK